MGFVGRISYLNLHPHAKLYVHTAGFDSVFGSSVDAARAYFEAVHSAHQGMLAPFDYVLAAAWGCIDTTTREAVKAVDIVGWNDFRAMQDYGWAGSNPDSDTIVIKNGVVSPDRQLCEDTWIAFGHEAALRRRTRSLGEFMQCFPQLPDSVQPAREDRFVV